MENLPIERIEFFWPWLAGFIDGEGTFGIAKRKPQYKTYFFTYRAYLSMTSTNQSTMEYIKFHLDKLIGQNVGHLHKGEYSQHNKNHKNFYLLTVAKFGQLKLLIPKLLPYLIMEKQQALLVLEFVESRNKKLHIKHSGSDISIQELAIHQTLKNLNRRGEINGQYTGKA